MNGPQPSFEETIHRVRRDLNTNRTESINFFLLFVKLKVQEALRKKEKFQREHEEVKAAEFKEYLIQDNSGILL